MYSTTTKPIIRFPRILIWKILFFLRFTFKYIIFTLILLDLGIMAYVFYAIHNPEVSSSEWLCAIFMLFFFIEDEVLWWKLQT